LSPRGNVASSLGPLDVGTWIASLNGCSAWLY
jgi:hypothetical protein